MEGLPKPLVSPISNFHFDVIEEVVVNDNEPSNDHDSGFSETIAAQLPICLRRSHNRIYRGSQNKRVQGGVPRLIKKSGKSNVIREHIPHLWLAYFKDLANTLVDSKWSWTVMALASSYILSWLLFAWFWMLIENSSEYGSPTNSKTICLTGINSFAGYFLFSLETQHTIGYGSRYITDNCPEATILMCVQVILGCAICGGVASIVYTKMVRPQKVHSEQLFSKYAVICQRDRKMCLIFRVRDEENKHSVMTTINAYLVESRSSKPFLRSLALEKPGLLLWPLEVVHIITPSSPFWNTSVKDFLTKRFEIIRTMQGTSAITGQSSLTRTSYLTSEILWGHRFKPCVKFDEQLGYYCVNHSRFNETEEILTPLCSAQRLAEVVLDLISPLASPVSLYSNHKVPLSSGIGSFKNSSTSSINEDMFPRNLCRKLSVIREWKSVEHVDTNESTVPKHLTTISNVNEVTENSGNQNKSDTITSNYEESGDEDFIDDDIYEGIKEGNLNNNSFNVKSLIASLQNLLVQQDEDTQLKTPFPETDF